MNVVIMVWKQQLDAGLGDLLRGTIHLHSLSRQLNFELIVDTQLHPVSKLLVSNPHKYSDYVVDHQSENIDLTNSPEKLENVIKNKMRRDNPLLITTNAYPTEPMQHDCKRFMRNLLMPNDEFKKWFNELRIKFHIPTNYAIAHFRLGDQELIHDDSNSSESSIDITVYEKLCGMVNFHMERTPNLYIMSDSSMFKQYLRERIRPELIDRIIPTTPIHLAHPDAAADIEKTKETMFDFMLLINARFIKTHSKYTWVSGFVRWASMIFNVPLFDIKPPKVTMKFQMGNSTPAVASEHTRIIINKPTGFFQKMF